MKRALTVLALAGCTTTSAQPGVVDRGQEEGWFQCPLDGALCAGELTPSAHIPKKDRRAWAERAPELAAKTCAQATIASGVGCVRTRLVVCSTQDVAKWNYCFLTWEGCRASVAMIPERKCKAYFAGNLID